MIYRVSLFGLPGFSTVGAAVFDSSYVPHITDTDIGLLAGEISTGDAAGYARITNIATTWNPATFRLDIDDPGIDTFDLLGAPDVATLVFYDPSDDALISWVPITPHAGFDAWPIPVASVADVSDTGYLSTQVAALGARVTDLEDGEGGGGGALPPPTPTPWLTTASYYLDRDRVWLGGVIIWDSSGSTTLATLPAPLRPTATRMLPVLAANDVNGTPSYVVTNLIITADGSVTLAEATEAWVGDVAFAIDTCSYRVMNP